MSGKAKKAARRAAEAVEVATVTPASPEVAKATKKPKPGTFDSKRGRLGAFALHGSRTPEERSAVASNASTARWDRYRAERAAAGLPSTKTREPLLSANELEHWLVVLDERFPDVQFTSLEARKRQAMILAKQAAALAELDNE